MSLPNGSTIRVACGQPIVALRAGQVTVESAQQQRIRAGSDPSWRCGSRTGKAVQIRCHNGGGGDIRWGLS